MQGYSFRKTPSAEEQIGSNLEPWPWGPDRDPAMWHRGRTRPGGRPDLIKFTLQRRVFFVENRTEFEQSRTTTCSSGSLPPKSTPFDRLGALVSQFEACIPSISRTSQKTLILLLVVRFRPQNSRIFEFCRALRVHTS